MNIMTKDGIIIHCLPENALCDAFGKSPLEIDRCPEYMFDDYGDYCMPEICQKYMGEIDMERKQYVSIGAVVDVIEQAAERDGYRKEYVQIKADDLLERIKNIPDFFYVVDNPSRDIAPTPKQSGNRPVNLSDTVTLMTSSDYKARFKAEYYQTKIRYEKLHSTIVKYEAGTLDFLPIELFKAQAEHMGKYLFDLEVRAKLEGIDL